MLTPTSRDSLRPTRRTATTARFHRPAARCPQSAPVVNRPPIDRRPQAARSLRRRFARYAAFVAVLLLAWSIRAWVADPVRVASQSMEPTLHRNNVVLVQKLGFGGLQRRELVAFRDPVRHHMTVKRVVGLPGDEIEIRDAILHVNGQPIFEPPVDYVAVDGLFFGPARVPQGSVFLMGDNRGSSIDSRTYGAVPLSSVAGRVVLRAWPLKTLG